MTKKLILMLIFFVACADFCLAQTQRAGIIYDSSYPYVFKNVNVNKAIKSANVNFLLAERSKTPQEKIYYYQQAMRDYFIVTKIDSMNIEACLGLARIYDAMSLDEYALEYYYNALNIDYNSPKANFYFANYYFKRDNFVKALYYYKIAYEHDYAKNYETNYRIGVIYEKLADIEAAKQYYKNALALSMDNKDLAAKIRILDELNYDNSQYYLFNKLYK